MKMVTIMQAKRYRRKGCITVHISSDKGKGFEAANVLSRYPILQEFQDVFPTNISKFPPHREVGFYIELVPRETQASKAPYKTNTPDLVEFKLQLKEMLDKGYIRPSV